MAVAIVLVLLGWMFAAGAGAQTVGPPAVTRGDSLISGSATVVWPATYDSSRATIRLGAQVRTAGVSATAVCRTKTGPWVRHIVVAPPPPPPPPVPPPAPPPPPPPPANAAPVARFTWTCTGLNVRQCRFDGSSSSDDVGVVSWSWQFSVAGWAPFVRTVGLFGTITFPAYGTYTATLTVSDAGGLTGSETQTFLVPDPTAPPPPVPPPPPPGSPPLPVGNVTLGSFVVVGPGRDPTHTLTSAADTAVTTGWWTNPTDAADSLTVDFVDFWKGGPPVNAIRRLPVSVSAAMVSFRQPIPGNVLAYAQALNVCRWKAGVAVCADHEKLVVSVP